YAANFEGDFLSNVFAYTIDAGTGTLSAVAGSPFMAGLDPTGVTVEPSGRFVYVANRQSANISAYAIDGATGALLEIAGSPYAGGIDLAVDPTGKFAYVAGNGILAYTINATTGTLTAIGAFAAGAGAYRVAIDPSGQFAYAVNRDGNDISAYRMNATSGALTSIGAAVPAGIRPQAITTTRKIP
ncbi:MAG: beta-propeller fold lactonase family protein, partial [Gammaproteobacteria bacterium]|nr:beta-propeller fold lactonase family protein [Gammaproteobacteria bacterium]